MGTSGLELPWSDSLAKFLSKSAVATYTCSHPRKDFSSAPEVKGQMMSAGTENCL